jgi:hypothetical protein
MAVVEETVQGLIVLMIVTLVETSMLIVRSIRLVIPVFVLRGMSLIKIDQLVYNRRIVLRMKIVGAMVIEGGLVIQQANVFAAMVLFHMARPVR